MGEKRQHTTPLFIPSIDGAGPAYALDPISLTFGGDNGAEKRYDEGWLQEKIYHCPTILPVNEIEPVFLPLYSVCRELKTPAGYLDNLYVNDRGNLTLVECKLWRNPEARREVIGQLLDYAKDLSTWSYEDLDVAIKDTLNCEGNPLFDAVASENPELDEAVFVDAVTRNLSKGRFLLLIVGDGIREGAENIVNFLQKHAGLDFTFGLVELALFDMPNDQGLLIQPRVIARTYNIERAVVRVEGGAIEVVSPPDQKVTHTSVGRAASLSEDSYYEALAFEHPQTAEALRSFMDELAELEITPVYGSSSLNLRWFPAPEYKMNFGLIRTDGRVNTDPANWVPGRIGHPEIGYDYQERLAEKLSAASVFRHPNGQDRSVRINGKYIFVGALLDIKDQWIEIMKATQEQLNAVVD